MNQRQRPGQELIWHWSSLQAKINNNTWPYRKDTEPFISYFHVLTSNTSFQYLSIHAMSFIACYSYECFDQLLGARSTLKLVEIHNRTPFKYWMLCISRSFRVLVDLKADINIFYAVFWPFSFISFGSLVPLTKLVWVQWVDLLSSGTLVTKEGNICPKKD